MGVVAANAPYPGKEVFLVLFLQKKNCLLTFAENAAGMRICNDD